MRRTILPAVMAALAFAIVQAAPTPATAQPYPNRPIKIIVPTPAGGPVDVMARLLANALPPVLGQNVIVENRAGAGNTLGSKVAAAADPDGYTLLVSAASGLIMSPMVYKSAGYDENSFAPIALVAETPQVLVAHPAAPFSSVAELVAYAKANPGKLNYSTGGAGTLPHLTAELFKQLAGVDIVHVPYKGGGPALTDVVAGQIQMTFDTVGTSVQFIRDGRLKALAVSNPTRLAEMPNVPTMPELGYPAINSGAWVAILAPLGAPPAIIARLNQATNDALASATMAEPLARLGAQPRGGSPDDLARHMKAEHAKWEPIVARLGLKEE
ncbi:MAG TPA: tripartite tricarboxylate transporter substrate binding protein [Xanthobacteraceae bacterium]|nr:tripartite tricarboxylate transporter substrate binding protein [Xanthobacteraceae bacterium]